MMPPTCHRDVCADDGFDIAQDGFSFPNWGDTNQPASNVTLSTLVDLFGHGVVCRPGEIDTCTATPRALHLQREWNAALGGGRCEGMATLSERMHMALVKAAHFDPSAQVAADLSRGNTSLESEITYWWATQFTDEVIEVAGQSRKQSLEQLVAALITGLNNSTGYTLGMYDKGMGHSVTPFAVLRTDNGWTISVYDNNYPAVVNHIIIDSENQRWSYNPISHVDSESLRQPNPGLATWSGTAGSLELTPMHTRSGPFSCSTCDDQFRALSTDQDTVISLIPMSTQAEVFLSITSMDGTNIISKNTATHYEDEIQIHRSKESGVPARVQIRLPYSIGDFQVHVISSALTQQPPPVLVTVSRPGLASVHLAGHLATPFSQFGETARSDTTSISVRPSELSITPHVDIATSVATSSHIVDAPLRAEHTLLLRSEDQETSMTIVNEFNVRTFSGYYPITPLLKTTPIQRVLIRDVNESLVITRSDIESVPLPQRTTSATLTEPRTNSDLPGQETSGIDQLVASDGSSNTINAPQSPTPVNGPNTNDVPPTISPPGTTPATVRGDIGVLAHSSGVPEILFVDKSQTVWVRNGNTNEMITLDINNNVNYRNVSGVPISMTQDFNNDFWILLQSPTRLLHATKDSNTYYTHSQLIDVSSIAMRQDSLGVYITGGSNGNGYIASFSKTNGFDFQYTAGISRPTLLTTGIDKSLWFADGEGGAIARIDKEGAIQAYKRSTLMVRAMSLGPDNAIWFVNNVAGKEIGRISTNGAISYISAPNTIQSLRDITRSSDGALWMTARGLIIRMATGGSFAIFNDTNPWGQSNIVAGSDQYLWYANSNFFTLSRITM
jgi:streptogramin lyase